MVLTILSGNLPCSLIKITFNQFRQVGPQLGYRFVGDPVKDTNGNTCIIPGDLQVVLKQIEVSQGEGCG
ncbi:hypothetical protein D3C76_891980 [compost metagenome]